MSEKDKLGILSELTALQAAIDKYIDEITTKNAEIGEKSRIILGELSSIKSYRDKIFNNMGMIIEFTCDKGINNPEVKAYQNVINMSLNALNNLDNTIDKLSNLSYGCISDAKQILLELDEYRNEINNPLKSDKMIDVTISSYERYVEEKVQPMINVLADKLKDGNIEKIDDISKKN